MFYIINTDDGYCLSSFDHTKYPSTEIKGGQWDGCWDTPDAWTESTDPEDPFEPAMLFKTEQEAQKIIDLMKNDPLNKDDLHYGYIIKKVTPPTEKTIRLSEDHLESLISTLECVRRRISNYGSFGDGDTYCDSRMVEKVLRQLK